LPPVEGRTEQACKALISQGLSASQQPKVKAVALDMWKAYANAVREQLPQADIVHDRFHISQHLNMAVDMVRKSENKKLVGQGDNRLKGSKFLWLINEEN